MYTMIFDTETTDLNKCFCYNIGFTILDTDTMEIVVKEDYVVEQVWHNLPLFQSAYYADKRPIYVSRMKGKKASLRKFGQITRRMYQLIKDYDIQYAYAYNSKFDEKVFDYNCDWFKCINPFDTVEVLDIRGLVHSKIAFTEDFKNFCDEHAEYTESGNYSTTAQTLFRYFSNDADFEEEHTALSDAIIETSILCECITKGCEFGKAYKIYNSIPKECKKEVAIIERNQHGAETITIITYKKMRINKKKSEIVLDI